MPKIKMSLENWIAWSPNQGEGGDKVDVSFLDPMVRRRLSNLTRIVIYVVHHCLSEKIALEDIALVFASRYGELNRTIKILNCLSSREAISPTEFSQSTPHTPSSLITIINKLKAPALTISDGDASLELALIESWTLLQTGDKSKILLVYFDEPADENYKTSASEIITPMALALLLSSTAKAAAFHLELDWEEGSHFQSQSLVNAPLRIFQLLEAEKGIWERETNRKKWRWHINKRELYT